MCVVERVSVSHNGADTTAASVEEGGQLRVLVLGRTRAPRMIKKLLNSTAAPSSFDRRLLLARQRNDSHRAEMGLISPLEHQ